MTTEVIIDKVVFEIEEQGYKIKASYLKQPEGNALIEITKGGEEIEIFSFPAYKIYNIAAHARDIIDSIKAKSQVPPKCIDCGMPYENFPLDTVMSDEEWKEIHPGKDGLLCAQCIVKRASAIEGVVSVRLTLNKV